MGEPGSEPRRLSSLDLPVEVCISVSMPCSVTISAPLGPAQWRRQVTRALARPLVVASPHDPASRVGSTHQSARPDHRSPATRLGGRHICALQRESLFLKFAHCSRTTWASPGASRRSSTLSNHQPGEIVERAGVVSMRKVHHAKIVQRSDGRWIVARELADFTGRNRAMPIGIDGPVDSLVVAELMWGMVVAG